MKLEEIRSALEGVSLETLADALAIVLAEGKTPSEAVAGMNRPELANFAQAVLYLKKNYAFDELEYFTTEADLVYVNAGGRRILLTDRMNSLSGMEGAAYSRKNDLELNTKALGGEMKEEPGEDTTPSGSNGGRFSNLEI